VVTDNAANIKSAVSSELQWKHLGCCAHSLNLVVQDSLKIVKPIQEKVKVVVAHFKRSAAALQKLLTFRRNSGTANPKKLIRDKPTQWNSTLFMFDRLSELQDAVRNTAALIDSEYLYFRQKNGVFALKYKRC
jgi:predicted HNH restriction endonuclease